MHQYQWRKCMLIGQTHTKLWNDIQNDFQKELQIIFSLHFYLCIFRTHSDCQILNGKAKWICNCISHVLQVMSLSYLNSNINYNVCFFTLSVLCMYPAKSQMESHFLHGKLSITVRGGTVLWGVFVLGRDVTNRQFC